MQSAGDYDAAARTLGVEPTALMELAREGGWDKELARLAGGRECRTPDDFIRAQRSFNRGINFVQAHRLRELVDVFLVKALSDPDFMTELTTVVSQTRDGFVIRRRDLRPVKDLADSVRTAHDLSYRALGDSTAQTVIDERELSKGGRNLQLDLMRAMDAHDAHPGTGSTALARSGALSPVPALPAPSTHPEADRLPEPIIGPLKPQPPLPVPVNRPVNRPLKYKPVKDWIPGIPNRPPPKPPKPPVPGQRPRGRPPKVKFPSQSAAV